MEREDPEARKERQNKELDEARVARQERLGHTVTEEKKAEKKTKAAPKKPVEEEE